MQTLQILIFRHMGKKALRTKNKVKESLIDDSIGHAKASAIGLFLQMLRTEPSKKHHSEHTQENMISQSKTSNH